MDRRTRWRFFKAVWVYRLRVLFNTPYKDTVAIEEFYRRYLKRNYWSCECGRTSATIPLKGQRWSCCPTEHSDGSLAGQEVNAASRRGGPAPSGTRTDGSVKNGGEGEPTPQGVG